MVGVYTADLGVFNIDVDFVLQRSVSLARAEMLALPCLQRMRSSRTPTLGVRASVSSPYSEDPHSSRTPTLLWASLGLSLSLSHTHTHAFGPLCPERPSLGQLGSGPLTRLWASLPRAAQHWLIQAPTRSPLCSALQGEFSCYRELTAIPG